MVDFLSVCVTIFDMKSKLETIPLDEAAEYPDLLTCALCGAVGMGETWRETATRALCGVCARTDPVERAVAA